MYKSKTQVYDGAAQGMVDRSVIVADGVLGWPPEKEKEYYAEMDKFGPGVIPILIRRYDSVKAHEENSYIEKLLIFAVADAVMRYDESATHPLGAERRQEALKFLADLLTPGQAYNISAFALIALQRCAAKVNITEPFVLEKVCQVLDRGDVEFEAYDIALEIVSVIGHGEAVAQRVEKAVNHMIAAHPTAEVDVLGNKAPKYETLRLARQTVQTIRQNANTPRAQ